MTPELQTLNPKLIPLEIPTAKTSFKASRLGRSGSGGVKGFTEFRAISAQPDSLNLRITTQHDAAASVQRALANGTGPGGQGRQSVRV